MATTVTVAGRGQGMEQEFRIGAAVRCADGSAGHLHRVIVDHDTNAVTHLVVDHPGHLGRHVCVGRDQVTATTPDEIVLRCNREDLRALPPFEEVVFLRPDQPHPTLGYLPTQYVFGTLDTLLRPLGAPAIPTPAVEWHVPEGGVAVGRGDVVEAADGPFGHVEEMDVDGATGRVRRLVVRPTHSHGSRLVAVPGAAIAEVREGGVRLRLTAAELTALQDQPAPGAGDGAAGAPPSDHPR